MSTKKPLKNEPSELFPIRAASTLTGVNAITLRAWERRYGLIQPLRTDKGHRLYNQQHIDLINHIIELLDKGISIGQVKEYLAQQQPHSKPDDIWHNYQQRMINAIVRFDDRALEHTYNDALALHPIDLVTQKLILPLLQSLGERWANQQGSVAEEHFFGCYLRNKLGARFHHESSRAQGPLLLAACLPGEHHEIGLLLASLTIMAHGYRIILLGADTPLAELSAPAKQTQAEAILLSGSISPQQEVVTEQLAKLVYDCGVPVYVGGKTALLHHDEIQHAGAIPLGSNLRHALSQLDSDLKQTRAS